MLDPERSPVVAAFFSPIDGGFMDERCIRAFVAVADSGSVSKAAVDLCYSQARVSQHIGLLEHDLGGPVFRRTGRGMELTGHGERVLPLARVILHALSLLESCRAAAILDIPKPRSATGRGFSTFDPTQPRRTVETKGAVFP